MNPLATLTRKDWGTAIIVAILAITVAAIGNVFKTSAQRQGADSKAERGSERLIEKKRNSVIPIEPVVITLVKTKKGVVRAGRKFDDPDNDWVRGLTLTAKNITQRTITYIDVSYSFERPKDDAAKPRLVDTLTFGSLSSNSSQKLTPGESVDLVVSDMVHDFLKEALAKAGYPASVNRIKFYLSQVVFEDGMMWSLGYWYKRDPANPENWISLPEIAKNVGPGRTGNKRDQVALRSHAAAVEPQLPINALLTSPQLPVPCQDPGFPRWVKCKDANTDACMRKMQPTLFSILRHTHRDRSIVAPCKQCLQSGTNFECENRPHCTEVALDISVEPELCGSTTQSECEFEGGYWNFFYQECEFEEASENDSFTCNDGIDNDFNGLIDCEEYSCNHYCAGGCSQFDWEICIQLGGAGCWDGNCYTPILVDVAGNGFQLSKAQDGVVFNLIPDLPVKVAWTTANTDDAWLALDRNGNGTIDSGHELFGNVTDQPNPAAGVNKNGFLALAEYDKPGNGGNGDNVINARDAIFTSLRLWQDSNHNGLSEAAELHTLQELGVATLDLNYKESKKTDQYGNKFGYRARVKDVRGNALGRWSWDVFLKMARP